MGPFRHLPPIAAPEPCTTTGSPQKCLDTRKADGRLMSGQLSAESSETRGNAAKDTRDKIWNGAPGVKSRLSPDELWCT